MTDGHTQRLESALAGRYRIQEKLGEGGMASVYLAEDVKHERNVALKILKPELAAVIGAERFLTEIKTTANLQHPHILPLFDSGEADGFLYYVMPFIDGETLQDRIGREGQLGVEEAVRIARDVADALDYAHRNDIIHRDIKPANILLHDGRPVVADFGIALAISAAGGGRMTETGLSLGTPHYMSPEQASADRDLSARSDVYSLGCVLYEMLAGQPPHTGPSAQNILVRILTEDPRDVTELRRTVPPHVAATVMKAIEKLPADRFDTAKEFLDALGDEGFSYTAVTRARPAQQEAQASAAEAKKPGLRPVTLLPWAVALVFAALALWSAGRGAAELPITRAALDLGPGVPAGLVNGLDVSPDGQTFLVVRRPSTQGNPLGELLVRRADEADFREVPGADTVSSAVFSPGGDWIAYAQPGKGIMKISVQGGAPQPVLLQGVFSLVLDWGAGGSILFITGDGNLYAVPENGGEERLVHNGFTPAGQFLPGGQLLLGVQGSGAEYWDLAADTSWVVVEGAMGPRYVPASGHLLWVDESGALWGAPFDPESGQLVGERGIVLEGVALGLGGFPQYAVSDHGTLLYSAGGESATAPGSLRTLVTVGLDGSVEVEDLEPRIFDWPRWSPDGRFVAYDGTEGGAGRDSELHIYSYDMVVKSRPRRLTSTGFNQRPVWSPDGTMLVFSSIREGADGADLYVKTVTDDAPPRLLLSLPGPQFPTDWISDSLLLIENGVGPSREVWLVELPGEGSGDSATARPYFESEFAHEPAYLAAQGDLITYSSDATGPWEVYTRSFPEAGAPEKITEGGGDHPKWSRDGNAIYYLDWPAFDSLWVARIDRGPPFAVLDAEPVIPWNYDSRFHLHPDGDRLIVAGFPSQSSVEGAPSEQGGAPPLRHFVVTNWFSELKARLGEGN
jgi:serine/threonine-protein kinase